MCWKEDAEVELSLMLLLFFSMAWYDNRNYVVLALLLSASIVFNVYHITLRGRHAPVVAEHEDRALAHLILTPGLPLSPIDVVSFFVLYCMCI